MILHAVSIAAFLLDSVQQAPVTIQCLQAAPESWSKWLVQFLVSLIPVVGGVGIALWSFRATSKRDHKRWLLDQKKAEWKELLDAASDCMIPLAIASTPRGKLTSVERAITEEEILKLTRIDQLLDIRMFIDQSILSPIRLKWHEARERATQGAEASNDEIAMSHVLLMHSILIKDLREAAKKDMGIEDI
jgi:hypothetical protein